MQVLNMTACTLAKIFTRQITTWDHPEIKKDNPGLVIPRGTAITVLRRLSNFSPSTASLAAFLNSWVISQMNWHVRLQAVMPCVIVILNAVFKLLLHHYMCCNSGVMNCK